MIEKKITPEEKLLKIIENPNEYTAPAALLMERQRGKVSVDIKRFFSLRKYFRFSRFKFQMPPLTLNLLIKVLIGAAVIITIFFVFNFTGDKNRLKEHFALISRGVENQEQKEIEKFFQKADADTVSKEAAKKNIFSFSQSAPAVKKEISQEKKDDLKLVGILLSANSQVMIEDTQTQRTYLLSVGEKIKTWEVKEIFKDKVVLSGEEGEWELR